MDKQHQRIAVLLPCYNEEAAVATDDEGLTLGVDRVEDGLHKVLGVVLAITYRIRH